MAAQDKGKYVSKERQDEKERREKTANHFLLTSLNVGSVRGSLGLHFCFQVCFPQYHRTNETQHYSVQFPPRPPHEGHGVLLSPRVEAMYVENLENNCLAGLRDSRRDDPRWGAEVVLCRKRRSYHEEEMTPEAGPS